MKLLSDESIKKLQEMEEAYIRERMDREPEDGSRKYSDIENKGLSVLHLKHENDPEKKQEIAEIAKGYYRRDFCNDLIKNFDKRMVEIGQGTFPEDEKEKYLSALTIYSYKLKAYNDVLSVDQYNKVLHGDDYEKRVINKDLEATDSVTSTIEKESLSLEELNHEELPVNPLGTETEHESKSLFNSIADFFAGVHKFLQAGLTSWWTGVPLDEVESIYDIYGSVSPDTVKRQRESEQIAAILDDDELSEQGSEPSKNTVEKTH